MIIFLIYSTHFKEAISLVANGYEIYWRILFIAMQYKFTTLPPNRKLSPQSDLTAQ